MRANLIALASSISLSVSAAGYDDPATTLHIRVEPSRDRQVVEGFGGSLAYWGFNADEVALRHALGEVGATIVRIPGEVSQSGDPEAYRETLRRVAKVAPGAKIYLTFWQPRSQDKPRPDDWLDVDETQKYRLKPALTSAWADEMVARIKLMSREWGANVVAVGVQNETNFSQPGTPTCAWDPDRLAGFIADELAPKMKAAGLGSIPLAAPELANLGTEAGEARKFAPALAEPAAAIFSYHMYDSFKEGTDDPGLAGVREPSSGAALGPNSCEGAPDEAGLDDGDDRGFSTTARSGTRWVGDPGSTSTKRRSRPPATCTPPWSRPVPVLSCGGGSAIPRPRARWKGLRSGRNSETRGSSWSRVSRKAGRTRFWSGRRSRTPFSNSPPSSALVGSGSTCPSRRRRRWCPRSAGKTAARSPSSSSTPARWPRSSISA